MDEHAIAVVDLLAAHDELIAFERQNEIVGGEPGDGQRDAQAVLADLFVIVGRITVAAMFGDTVERALELVEAEQQRIVEHRQARHVVGTFRSTPESGRHPLYGRNRGPLRGDGSPEGRPIRRKAPR